MTREEFATAAWTSWIRSMASAPDIRPGRNVKTTTPWQHFRKNHKRRPQHGHGLSPAESKSSKTNALPQAGHALQHHCWFDGSIHHLVLSKALITIAVMSSHGFPAGKIPGPRSKSRRRFPPPVDRDLRRRLPTSCACQGRARGICASELHR